MVGVTCPRGVVRGAGGVLGVPVFSAAVHVFRKQHPAVVIVTAGTERFSPAGVPPPPLPAYVRACVRAHPPR